MNDTPPQILKCTQTLLFSQILPFVLSALIRILFAVETVMQKVKENVCLLKSLDWIY
jgi:hypothetical protein